MPAGDAQRQWFPEMVKTLREQWAAESSWDELVLLANRLDATLQRIREERKLQPPMFTCPACGVRARSTFPRISVNATILAAGRFGVCTQAEARKMSGRWTRYRKAQHLDLYGAREDAS